MADCKKHVLEECFPNCSLYTREQRYSLWVLFQSSIHPALNLLGGRNPWGCAQIIPPPLLCLFKHIHTPWLTCLVGLHSPSVSLMLSHVSTHTHARNSIIYGLSSDSAALSVFREPYTASSVAAAAAKSCWLQILPYMAIHCSLPESFPGPFPLCLAIGCQYCRYTMDFGIGWKEKSGKDELCESIAKLHSHISQYLIVCNLSIKGIKKLSTYIIDP